MGWATRSPTASSACSTTSRPGSLHGEQALDQWFLWRPFLGSGRYRLPVEGLYLCGSGAHPGGGITGQPGQNAAREILSDLKRRR